MKELKEVFKNRFDVRDNGLFYKETGKRAGWLNSNGYERVTVNGKNFYVHRIVYFLKTGKEPQFIDHIDGDRRNNSFSNLRSCTRVQNNQNTAGKTTYKNVTFHKKANKWQVRLKANYKDHYLGLFEDFELACLVAEEARRLFHGEFAR